MTLGHKLDWCGDVIHHIKFSLIFRSIPLRLRRHEHSHGPCNRHDHALFVLFKLFLGQVRKLIQLLSKVSFTLGIFCILLIDLCFNCSQPGCLFGFLIGREIFLNPKLIVKLIYVFGILRDCLG